MKQTNSLSMCIGTLLIACVSIVPANAIPILNNLPGTGVYQSTGPFVLNPSSFGSARLLINQPIRVDSVSGYFRGLSPNTEIALVIPSSGTAPIIRPVAVGSNQLLNFTPMTQAVLFPGMHEFIFVAGGPSGTPSARWVADTANTPPTAWPGTLFMGFSLNGVPVPGANPTIRIDGTFVGIDQDEPIMPTNNNNNSNTFTFNNVPGGNWFDPPIVSSFNFTAEPGSLFAHVLDFPTGFSNPFIVSVGGTTLGQYLPGQSVDFSSYPGGGVSNFVISGINPGVDAADPLGFPIKLDFTTPTASFSMTGVVPEPVGLPIVALLVSAWAARRRRIQ